MDNDKDFFGHEMRGLIPDNRYSYMAEMPPSSLISDAVTKLDSLLAR